MDISQMLSSFFLFFTFLLSTANGKFESGSSENPRQFHIDQHKETREFFKSEMEEFFSNLLDSLNQKLAERNSETFSKLEILNERILKLERNQEELSANLLRTLNESMGSLNRNLSDSFNEGLASSDLKMKSLFLNLSETFSQKLELKMEKSLANLSGLLIGELSRNDLKVERTSVRNLLESLEGSQPRNESKLTGEIEISTETTRRNEQQTSPMTTPLTTLSAVTTTREIVPTFPQPPTRNEVHVSTYIPIGVEEVNFAAGTIHFSGGDNSSLRRKIWIFRSERGTSLPFMRFQLEQNGLGANGRLSLWGAAYGKHHVWTGSQSDWTQRMFAGPVNLVTLTMSPSAGKTPSFKLKFTTTDSRDDFVCSSKILRGEGRQVVSFSPNYHPMSLFVAVIAPPSGVSFQLTLKYLDLPGTPPSSCQGDFYVWFFEESSTGHYRQLPPSVVRQCGRVGAISEPLGNSTVAIIRFVSAGGSFRVEVN